MSRIVALLVVFSFLSCDQLIGEENDTDTGIEPVTVEESTVNEIDIYDLSYRHIDNVQSPINLEKNIAMEKSFAFDAKIDANLSALLRKAHTIELKISEGSYVEVLEHTYFFKQLHFHTPAEHSMDKLKHPMEMHLVSVKTDSLEPDLPHYLVIGITFNEGKENKLIQSIIDNTPHINPNDFMEESEDGEEHNGHNSFSIYADLANSPIDLNTLFGDPIENHFNNMFHYKGSLTTYPYTESVEWYVLSETVEISKEQIEQMNEFMGDNSRISQEKTHLEYGFDHMFD